MTAYTKWWSQCNEIDQSACSSFPIHHFHIDYNASSLPPKVLRSHCFQFLLGITVISREIEDDGYAKFFGREVGGGLTRCIKAYVKMVAENVVFCKSIVR